jgi:hypothetical protein
VTARTVTSTVHGPAPAALRASMKVTVELLTLAGRRTGGFVGNGNRVNGWAQATTDDTGTWTLDLEPNAGTGVSSPAESIYQVTEHPQGYAKWTYYILVPDSPGPHDAADIEVDADGVPTGSNDDVMRYADGTVMRYEDGTAMRYDT